MGKGWLRNPAVGLTALLLAGCAAQEIENTESLLGASGFAVLPASTPQRVASLERLPPGQLVMSERDGHPVWMYADPERCHCLYVGGPKAYQHYESLRVRQNIAQTELQAQQLAQMNWNWGFWGPWPPMGPFGVPIY